ncbi:ABC transporter substrate-binding protein [Dictyobacter kobayashii]|uniref:ABC transporter substrate-binding protein n=1 Tax=Dictyobacter kobayashii TaxID=2014872 RepID=A0A402AQB1_9CHLR|nr:ABC transporter substrate-binding protein [Dictyobacter kobayashii]GCE21358.1 ABC transporter substrate-binding protein [Dictyobacter kobayashii]
MPIFDRRQRHHLDQLVEDFVITRIPRREFLCRAMAAGLSISAATTLLAACEDNPGPQRNGSTKVQSIDVLTEWSGEELDSFNMINAVFTKKTGIKVNVETTRDLLAVLTTRLRGNNPPDVSGMPSVSHFHELAAQNKLVRLDTFFNMQQYQKNYAQAWIDYSSDNGKVYAVLPKANTKGTIWYNPQAFHEVGVSVPQTWDELLALSDKLARQGKYPWSLGVESGATSGWPAADWIAEIYLNKYGPDLYDQWVAHKIPWTDASIKDAFRTFGQIALGKHYVNGGAQAILATNFQDASYLPFEKPAKAYMYYLGDFAAGFIKNQFKTIKSGQDFSFFPFPSINPQYKGSVIGGADLLTAFKDNDGSRQFMEFMTTAEAQSIWVKRGGATSVNSAVEKSVYPDAVAWATAQQMTKATAFRVSADDLIPQTVQYAFWKGTLTYISDPGQLDSVLNTIESQAQLAYQA